MRDTKTAEGVHQPATSLRSGGPGSVIPWDTLGWQGRNFIGKGPSVSDIEKSTGQPAMEPIRDLRRPGVGPRRRGPGRPGGPGPRARGRFPAQEPARGDDDRQRLGRPGAGGLVRVPHRRRLGDRGDPVLLPAVVDLLPGGPVQGPRGGPRAVRRGLRRLVAAAARTSAPGCTWPAKASGRSAARPPSAASTSMANLHRRRAVRRAAQLQHAVPGVHRPPRRRQPRGPARLPRRADRAVRGRRDHGHTAGRASPGTAAGSCT